MGYARSRPYKDFCNEIDNIISILKGSQKNKNLEGIYKDYIHASAIFLAHAELENYIQDTFNLFIKNLNSIKFSDLNENLRAFLIFKFFNFEQNLPLLLSKKQESEIISYIKKETVKSPHLFDKNMHLPTFFKGSHVYETFKYPSEKNLNKVYNRIGCQNIFNLISSEVKKNAKNILSQLSTYRTTLAHGNGLVGVSVDDLLRILQDIKIFAKGLDRVLYKQVAKDYKEAFWKCNLV